jgi:hypothetical protein
MITFKTTTEPDDDADLSWLDDTSKYAGIPEPDFTTYLNQDRERLAAYHRGEWAMVGLVVTARIDGQEIDREALWGIEDDSDPEYFTSVADDLKAEIIGRFPKLIADLQGFIDAQEVKAIA